MTDDSSINPIDRPVKKDPDTNATLTEYAIVSFSGRKEAASTDTPFILRDPLAGSIA
jgi:hypothetical protein